MASSAAQSAFLSWALIKGGHSTRSLGHVLMARERACCGGSERDAKNGHAVEAASALRAHCLLATGGVLFCLFLQHGDLTISLQSGTPVYAAVYLSFYLVAAMLYVMLQRSDPGFLTTEEHHTLLENGEMRHMSRDRLGWPPRLLPALSPICAGHLVVNKSVYKNVFCNSESTC
jgi:hypothetical protein